MATPNKAAGQQLRASNLFMLVGPDFDSRGLISRGWRAQGVHPLEKRSTSGPRKRGSACRGGQTGSKCNRLRKKRRPIRHRVRRLREPGWRHHSTPYGVSLDSS